jgi:hypothetical protein
MENPPLASLSLTHVHYVGQLKATSALDANGLCRTPPTASHTYAHGSPSCPKGYA